MSGKLGNDVREVSRAQNKIINDKYVDPEKRVEQVLLDKGVNETDPLKAEVTAGKLSIGDMLAIVEQAKVDAAPFALQYKAFVDDFAAKDTQSKAHAPSIPNLLKRVDNLPRSVATRKIGIMPGVTNITLISTALGAGKTRIPFDTIHMAVVRGFAALRKLDNASVRVVPFSFRFFPLSIPTADHHENRGHDEHGENSHYATIHLDKHKNYSFHCGRTHRRYGHSSSYKRTHGPNNSLDTLEPFGSSALAARLHRPFRHRSCPCPVQTATTSSR